MSVKSTHIRYPFAPLREGAFFFPTDNGCFYTVEFAKSAIKLGKDTLLQNNGEVYEISFTGTCDDIAIYDSVVSATLIHIITTNIISRGDTAVHFYVCDNTDGFGKLRSRLFDLWYIGLEKEIAGLEKFNYMLKGIEEEEYHVSLFIFDNHPEYDNYVASFEKNLSENFSKS